MAIQEKLSDRIQTALSTDGFVHIILPGGGGPSGFQSFKISTEDLRGLFKERFANKSAAFTVVLDADLKLVDIDFIWVASNPVVKVGTTGAGTKDIISGRTLSSVKNSTNSLSDYFKTSKTLYFTITGGTVDVIINYKKTYNT